MKRLILVLMVVLATAGCSKAAPKCSDPNTIDMVKQIYTDHLTKLINADAAKKVTVSLSGIRTTATDKDTGKQDCACDMNLKVQVGDKIEEVGTLPLTFYSEFADKKEHYVSALLQDQHFPLGMMMALIPVDPVRESQQACVSVEGSIRAATGEMEAYFVDNKTYPQQILWANVKPYPDVTIEVVSSTQSDYLLKGTHPKCNKILTTQKDVNVSEQPK